MCLSAHPDKLQWCWHFKQSSQLKLQTPPSFQLFLPAKRCRYLNVYTCCFSYTLFLTVCAAGVQLSSPPLLPPPVCVDIYHISEIYCIACNMPEMVSQVCLPVSQLCVLQLLKNSILFIPCVETTEGWWRIDVMLGGPHIMLWLHWGLKALRLCRFVFILC